VKESQPGDIHFARPCSHVSNGRISLTNVVAGAHVSTCVRFCWFWRSVAAPAEVVAPEAPLHREEVLALAEA